MKSILSEGNDQSKLLVESNEILLEILWGMRNTTQTL